MKLIDKNDRYSYWIADNGTIYRKSGKGLKEVKKRLGQRGYCEFKMNGKTVLYHQIVAQHLVPNPKNGNMVFFNSYDMFDLRPQNLRWVWKRQGLRYTPAQALQKTKDQILIQYYETGNISLINRKIPELITALIAKFGKERVESFVGNLYLLIYDYAERCLLFDLKKDIQQTYLGLIKQEKRVKVKTVQLNERFI